MPDAQQAVGSNRTASAIALAGVLVSLLGPVVLADEGPPAKASDLFAIDKVWTLHLRFEPEQWAAMEPKGGMNPFDMSAFGNGMFLAPAMMRDGDQDKDESLSSAEFREVGRRWFAAWDRDGDGLVDATQIREGLKTTLKLPGADDQGGPPPGMSLRAPDGKRNGLSGMMGMDFEYVHADLEFAGKTFGDVGVRYKGNGTFLESRSTLKRPLKIDLNKYVKGQKIAGVATLNLHNNVTDAGMMQEVLALRLYRDAGVPSPRTAYARVYVTVPGMHERAYFGLYSLIENVDKDFVADHRLGKGGAIFKPSTPDLFDDLGDDWSAYQQTYDPKTDLTREQERRVIAFCRLVSQGTDEAFATAMEDYVDLDEFARFLAVSAWVGDLDGILGTGQNYYLFLDPKNGNFRFIPWDKDHTFGSWVAHDYAERVRHSIREPWDGKKRFLERAFKVEAFRSRYLAAMTTLHETLARPERIENQAKGLGSVLRPAVEEESAQKRIRFDAVVAGQSLIGGFFGLGKPSPTMLAFAKDRAASVADQLAGKDEGIVLGRPKPGDNKTRAGPPPLEEMIEPALTKALDSDKDGKLRREEFVDGLAAWFDTWDTEKVGKLGADTIRKGLNKALPFSFGPPNPPNRDEPNAK